MRSYVIAGNWKLNAGGGDGCELATKVALATKGIVNAKIVVAPPFTALAAVSSDLGASHVEVAGQNLYPEDKGAFTGEVSAPMLLASGAKWVIVGHSERRQYFAETDEFVAKKTAAAIKAGLRPIVCIGETLAEREANKTLEVVFRQLDAVTSELRARPGFGVIAYEPVWAIGTGKVATTEQARGARGDPRAPEGDLPGARERDRDSLRRQREGGQRPSPARLRGHRRRARRRRLPRRGRLRQDRTRRSQLRTTR